VYRNGERVPDPLQSNCGEWCTKVPSTSIASHILDHQVIKHKVLKFNIQKNKEGPRRQNSDRVCTISQNAGTTGIVQTIAHAHGFILKLSHRVQPIATSSYKPHDQQIKHAAAVQIMPTQSQCGQLIYMYSTTHYSSQK
jgi:hypothetical protein